MAKLCGHKDLVRLLPKFRVDIYIYIYIIINYIYIQFSYIVSRD